jgi:hypothetical protein
MPVQAKCRIRIWSGKQFAGTRVPDHDQFLETIRLGAEISTAMKAGSACQILERGGVRGHGCIRDPTGKGAEPANRASRSRAAACHDRSIDLRGTSWKTIGGRVSAEPGPRRHSSARSRWSPTSECPAGRKACKLMGYHRGTLYEVKRAVQIGGVATLVEQKRFSLRGRSSTGHS